MRPLRRFGTIIFLLIATLCAAAMALAAATPVSNTKHNLSTSGPGAIKSTGAGTSEICVFCHTPHSAKADAPLWNKSISNASYNVYTSDVLSQLGGGTYPGAETPATGAPHVKTRICLSCHDGTIALGSLVNMPSGVSTIPMQGTGADYKMPQTAAGYIGLDLRDDHPVAIIHDSTKDNDLKSTVTGSVYLYDNAVVKTQTGTGTGYVECTSCHNAHDNQYGNFLVDSNSQSGICRSCHQKTGFTTSSHDDLSTTTPYSPTNGAGGFLGSTVGEVKCMNCHFPHKAGLAAGSTTPDPTYGAYLLSFKEENSCFVNNPSDRWGTSNAATACHGSGGAVNIETEIKKSYKHPIIDSNTSPRHTATEAQSAGWFNSAGVWHTECADCHNPHTAGKTSHTAPVPDGIVLTAASPLYGTGGVNVAFPAGNWGAPNPTVDYSYAKSTGVVDASAGADKEYKICFKCHSAYAWYGGSVPTSTSLGAAMTDQALEFNPNNDSFHPVAGANNKNNNGTYVTPWAGNSNQTMYCSDCHTRNGAISPQGPHGSNEKFILSYAYTDSTGATTDPVQPSTDICFMCHDVSTYLSGSETPAGTGTGFRNGTYNLHTRHKSLATSSALSLYAYRCVNCHTRIPHGWKRKAMIILSGEGIPNGSAAYEPASGAKISSISPDPPASGGYTTRDANCSTVAGCHHNP
jgi:predicted CXXCH cytochrome family protein